MLEKIDRLQAVFVVGLGSAVIGTLSWTLTMFCTGLVLMTAAICTVEIAERIEDNK